MFLFYIDESGSPGAADSENFVMGGLAVFERTTFWLSEELDKLQAKYFPGTSYIEFHSHAVQAHKKEPWHSLPWATRDRILLDLAEILNRSHESVKAFAVVVHQPSYPGENPVVKCFEQLCTRFDLYLKRLHSQGNTQRGLMILDESKYAVRLTSLLDQYRQVGTAFGRVHNFSDIPLFADSKATRLLQLADFVSWAVYRRYERGDSRYFDRIVNRFDAEGSQLHGLVHMSSDRRGCMCPACMSRRYSATSGTP